MRYTSSCIVAVLLWWNTEREATIEVVGGVEAGAPRLERERWISNNKVERLEAPIGLLEIRTSENIVLPDFRRGAVVKDHVHLGQGRGGVVHFLSIERQVEPRLSLSFVVSLEQQRAGTAGGIVDRLAG